MTDAGFCNIEHRKILVYTAFRAAAAAAGAAAAAAAAEARYCRPDLTLPVLWQNQSYRAPTRRCRQK